jgi:two-component system chemotaxis response regulator CheB
LIKVLIVEDDIISAKILAIMLKKQNYHVSTSQSAKEALKLLQTTSFDIVLTDWMMPEMDGMELVRQVRATISPCPIIIMSTAITSVHAKSHVLKAGADDYLTKPYKNEDVIKCIETHLQRRQAEKKPITLTQTMPKVMKQILPPFFGVPLVAGSGGLAAYVEIFRNIPNNIKAAFFVVLHAPAFIIQTFAENLQKEVSLPVVMAQNLMEITPSKIYIAPGDYHLFVQNPPLQLKLVDSPPENFVRPSADPLFRSIAEVFGPNALAIILTGLGRDGLSGTNKILQAGGTVLVQDPKTAFSSLLPQNIIKADLMAEVVPLEQLANEIIKNVR